jgi:hypothetical protein
MIRTPAASFAEQRQEDSAISVVGEHVHPADSPGHGVVGGPGKLDAQRS